MTEFMSQFSPVTMALIATLFTWGMTALGSTPVFLTSRLNQKLLDGMLGLAAGIMVAASFWSLLNPAVEQSHGDWRPATFGFLVGAVFLYVVHRLLPHVHAGVEGAEGVQRAWRRSVLLVMAIVLHNIPEGLAVGVAFGLVGHLGPGEQHAAIVGGVTLAIGIGLQNFPEGLAVAMPLRREGFSPWRAFMFGQFSGIVEPVAAVLGAALVVTAQFFLPYALSFAAGAMIYVVVKELIPESQRTGNSDLATLSCIFGFAIMMAMEVGLG